MSADEQKLTPDKLREAKTRLQNLEKHMGEGFVQPGDPWHTAYLALEALLLIAQIEPEHTPSKVYDLDQAADACEAKGHNALLKRIQKIIGGLDAA